MYLKMYMILYSIFLWLLPKFFLYTFSFFHSYHYLCLPLNPSESAFFFVSFSVSLVWCFPFSFLLLIHLYLHCFAGQKMGTTSLQNDITKQRCVLVVSEQRCAKCSSLYSRIIWEKNDRITFSGKDLGMDLAGQLHGLNTAPVVWKYKENKRK